MIIQVTIQRTIATVIRLNVSSTAEARRTVAAYGLVEAVSDYPVVSETVVAKVVRCEAAQ